MINLKEKKVLIFDIEVAAYDFESYFDDETKKYLLKYAKDEEEQKKTIESLVFTAFASELVCIGMIDYNENKGSVLINTGEKMEIESGKENIKYVCGTEKETLEMFWKIVQAKDYQIFVTFNGREFDCPFVMIKSLILKVRPTFNLMKGSDFTFKDYHIDLLKELTFYKHSPTGARRKFSLDFYCKQLGIQSPKSEGISGEIVGELYKNKEYKKIADYCIGDVIATGELLKIWDETLNL